jgi:tRNA (cytidine32/uridine32-2'-O)-methyltransferase
MTFDVLRDRRHLAVILVRPREEGNVGSVARAMANMGLERLILVEPAPRIQALARAFAVGAGSILDAVERAPTLRAALVPFRRVVGTTSARERVAGVEPIEARQLPSRLEESGPEVQTALVFGPEVSGLTNEELALCSLLVRIPAAREQPTLNLAQAVLILTYELFLAHGAPGSGGPRPRRGDGAEPATHDEVEGLFAQWLGLLSEAGFARDSTFETVARDLRAWLARSSLSIREVRILRGIARRLRHRLRIR